MRKLLFLVILMAGMAFGQAATLLTIPHQHFHNSDGTLCSGCTVTTYTAGTSTPTATYTSKTGLVTNANPLTLNSRGEPTSDGSTASSIFIKAGTCLKLVLKDSAGATISTEDNICSDPAAPASLTSNNAGGYGWSLTQQSATGGGVNIVPGADSGTGEEAIRVRNTANSSTAVSCWGNGNCTLTGTIQAAIATITGNATIGGTLTVTGAQTLTGATTASTSLKVGSTGTVMTRLKADLVSLNVASVAANTTAEQTFTVTGLTTSDAVFVNKSSLSAGLGIVNARVSAADTLAITFVNATGAPIDPAAENYYIFSVRF